MVKVLLNNAILLQINAEAIDYLQIQQAIEDVLQCSDFYLTHDGRKLNADYKGIVDEFSIVRCCLRVHGGKGGFGSMLRAIGAQIEKTTNREACRDLSGRRLRDINEEKRLKAWLEKQAERDREAEERKKRKIAKLLAVPKHDFKDTDYEEARSKLTEKVSDAVEKGFKKAQLTQNSSDKTISDQAGLKRKAEASTSTAAKKKRPALWIGDDISESDSNASDDEIEEASTKQKSLK